MAFQHSLSYVLYRPTIKRFPRLLQPRHKHTFRCQGMAPSIISTLHLLPVRVPKCGIANEEFLSFILYTFSSSCLLPTSIHDERAREQSIRLLKTLDIVRVGVTDLVWNQLMEYSTASLCLRSHWKDDACVLQRAGGFSGGYRVLH